jgi:hypothetical protein
MCSKNFNRDTCWVTTGLLLFLLLSALALATLLPERTPVTTNIGLRDGRTDRVLMAKSVYRPHQFGPRRNFFTSNVG